MKASPVISPCMAISRETVRILPLSSVSDYPFDALQHWNQGENLEMSNSVGCLFLDRRVFQAEPNAKQQKETPDWTDFYQGPTLLIFSFSKPDGKRGTAWDRSVNLDTQREQWVAKERVTRHGRLAGSNPESRYNFVPTSSAPPPPTFTSRSRRVLHLRVMVYKLSAVSPRAHLLMVEMLRFMSGHKPTELAHSFLFCSCVCFCLYGTTLSTVFHSINSSDNSPLSHSVALVLSLPYWSFQLYISLWKSPSALISQLWCNLLWLNGLKAPAN